jgi:hypothetical protein
VYSLLAEVVYIDSTPLHRYSEFIDFVVRQDLQNAYLVTPLLDGNDIKDLFQLSKGGSFLPTAIDKLLAWQLDNESCGVDEAKI